MKVTSIHVPSKWWEVETEIQVLRMFQRNGLKLDDFKFAGFVRNVRTYRTAKSKKIWPFRLYVIRFWNREKCIGSYGSSDKWRSIWWIKVDSVWLRLDEDPKKKKKNPSKVLSFRNKSDKFDYNPPSRHF